MPASGTIDQLLIEIKGTATGVSKSIDKVTKSLQGLYSAIDLDVLTKFNNKLAGISEAAKDMGASLKKISKVNVSINQTTKSMSRLGDTVSSAAGFLLGGIDAGYLANAFGNATKEATSYFETVNYFNIAMGQFSEQAYEYAQKVSNVLGINEEDWMSNQATFMSLATTFGNTSDNAYLMSQNLTQLTYDLSSLKNVNADVAMQKLRSAFAGEIEPLRDWGVDLSKANLQLVALEHNITKPFDQMTQAEKSQLRYVTIMNQLEYAMGDLSNTLNQPANQLRVLETAITKCARALGNIFIPLLNMILPLLISFANVVRMVLEQIAALFGFEYPKIENWNRYADGAGALADNLDEATGRAKALKKQLAGFDEINNLTTNQGSGSGDNTTGSFGGLDLPTYESLGKSFISDALEEKITNITDKIKELLPYLTAIGTAILVWKGYFAALNLIPKIMKIFDWIKRLWALFAANPFVLVAVAIAALVAWFITAYKTNDEFRAKVDAFVADAKEKIVEIWNKLTTFISNLKTKFAEFFSNLGEKLSNFWTSVVTTVTNIKDKVVTIAGNIGQAFKNVIQAIKDWFVEKWNGIKYAWGEIMKSLKDNWDGFKDKIKTGVDAIVGFWDGIKQGAKDMANGVIGAVEGMVNKVISGVNWLIRGLNRIRFSIPDWVPLIGGNSFGFNLGQINSVTLPRLAQGGVVSSPTTALIGENGAEAVVPLENNTDWINKVAAQINSNSDNSQIIVMLDRIIEAINDKDLDVTIGDRDIYNANRRETNRQNRLLGRAY